MDTKSRENFLLNFDYITIAGGGIKGIGFVGALTALDKAGIINKLKGYSGSSIGSVLCLLLNLGYSINEMKDIAFGLDFEQFKDPKVSLLLNDFGFDNGSKINKLLYAIIKQKQNPDITFKQLYELTDKLLVVTGSNINKGIAEYFSHITTPDMQIIQAIRISIAFPIYFTPVKVGYTVYSDGALFDPCPIKFFDDKSKIIAIVNRSRYNLASISSFESYLYYMVIGVSETYIDIACEPIKDNAIFMNFNGVSAIDFDISKTIKSNLFDIGYFVASSFIIKKKHVLNVLKRFVSVIKNKSK